MAQFAYSMFHDIFLPGTQEGQEGPLASLQLEQVRRFKPPMTSPLDEWPWVVFDFETTGLDSRQDHIIEIGGIKVEKGVMVEEFSTLIKPPVVVSEQITQITGITEEMLFDQPAIEEVLFKFLEFIKGSVLLAHNAEFDLAFLQTACRRAKIQLDWPVFCSLKMARVVLPELESKNLDTLAEHYGLTFESRHRSIGDCKVTSAVVQAMLSERHDSYQTLGSLEPFFVS